MSNDLKQEYYITPDEAIAKQDELRERIKIQPYQGKLKTVTGADISFNRGSNELHAGFVVLRLPDLKMMARSLATKTVKFPYIPGLLAFRERPCRKPGSSSKISPTSLL